MLCVAKHAKIGKVDAIHERFAIITGHTVICYVVELLLTLFLHLKIKVLKSSVILFNIAAGLLVHNSMREERILHKDDGNVWVSVAQYAEEGLAFFVDTLCLAVRHSGSR